MGRSKDNQTMDFAEINKSFAVRSEKKAKAQHKYGQLSISTGGMFDILKSIRWKRMEAGKVKAESGMDDSGFKACVAALVALDLMTHKRSRKRADLGVSYYHITPLGAGLCKLVENGRADKSESFDSAADKVKKGEHNKQ